MPSSSPPADESYRERVRRLIDENRDTLDALA
jgi:hypothetical protein